MNESNSTENDTGLTDEALEAFFSNLSDSIKSSVSAIDDANAVVKSVLDALEKGADTK